MKNLFLIILILFSISNNVFSQDLKWSKNQGSSTDDVMWDVAVDSNNNTFSFGIFSGSMKLGTKTYNTKGGRDHFIVKYDCGGNVQWVQTIGSTSDEYAFLNRMSMDKQGNIYVASAFAGSCTFSSANNSTKTVSSNGDYDIYVAKYDNSGNVKWVKSFGNSTEDVAYDIASDDSSNVYVTGRFKNTVSFGSTSLTSSAGFDIFVLKLDENGTMQWAKQGSGASDDQGHGIAVDSKHNVIVTGNAGPNKTVTFNGISSLYCSYATGIVARLDINGDCQWLESIYSSTYGGFWMTTGTDDYGNIYVGGSIGGTSTVTSEDGNNYSGGSIAGRANLCIAKYDTAGNLKWVISEGSSVAGKITEVYGVNMSKDNNRLYIAGSAPGSISLGSYSNNFQGVNDAIIAAIDTGGNFLWVDYIAGTGNNHGLAAAVDKSDNVYTCGQFSTSFALNNITTTSVGGQDGYVLKYCNTSANIDSTITTTGSTTLCGKDSVLFSVAYDPTYSYQWRLNGSSITGANSYYYYASKSGSYSVLIAKDGCCSQALSQSVQVQNLVFGNVLGADTIICGASYILGSNMPQGSKYLWNTGDTSNTTLITNSGVYSIIAAYNGCVTYDTIHIDIKNLVVNLGNDTVVCNASYILDAQNAGKTYKWSDGSTNQTLKATKTGSYAITITDGQCTATDNIFVTIDVVTLYLGKDIKTCQSQSNPYTLDAGSASLYNWSTGDNTKKINVNTSGNYWCIITDVLGCKASDTISISYYTAASAHFTDSMISQHTIKFTPDSTQYASYLWTFDGTSNSSVVSPTQYFSQSGTATAELKVTTKDGCVDSFTKTVYTTEINSKIRAEYNINIFPNPSNGIFMVDLNLQKKSDIVIQSFDLSGRKVYENKISGTPAGEQLFPINMQNLPTSIYIIKITLNGTDILQRQVNIIHE